MDRKIGSGTSQVKSGCESITKSSHQGQEENESESVYGPIQKEIVGVRGRESQVNTDVFILSRGF